MTKYKICKFVNGNGEEWYQIQKKGWFFWSYLSSYKYIGPLDFPPLKTILSFETMEKASEHIEMIKKIKKSWQIKKVECIDYA
jgi:hypothetical protein